MKAVKRIWTAWTKTVRTPAPVQSPPTEKPRVLLLIGEVGASFDRRRDLLLADILAKSVEIVVVAPCYAKSAKALKRSKHAFHTYGFGEARFETEVQAFASWLVDRHHPDWVLAVGGANSALVVALDRLSVAVLSFVPQPPRGSEDGELYRIFRHATAIRLADPSIVSTLRDASFSLAARTYTSSADTASDITNDERHVEELVDLGREMSRDNSRVREEAERDAAIIQASGDFSLDLSLPVGVVAKDTDTIKLYLRASSHCRPRNNVHAGRLVRRPAIGFHPLIYATEANNFVDADGVDPFAHFLREGSPPGRWSHEVIRCRRGSVIAYKPKSAIHLHLHYTDLLEEFLDRLSSGSSCETDLIITTSSQAKAAEIDAVLARRQTRARVLVYNNRGRDVWPFVDLLQTGAFDPYEVVGHFHGKKSPSYDMGDMWRHFLWEHLIGGSVPAADIARHAFGADEKLGLLFPEEPHLDGWDANKTKAEALAQRMGIIVPLPPHLEYPVGTMFWARPEALRPLRSLNWREDDIPCEPLPNDGTDLHAIECLLVFIAEAAGFGYATTHVPGGRR